MTLFLLYYNIFLYSLLTWCVCVCWILWYSWHTWFFSPKWTRIPVKVCWLPAIFHNVCNHYLKSVVRKYLQAQRCIIYSRKYSLVSHTIAPKKWKRKSTLYHHIITQPPHIYPYTMYGKKRFNALPRTEISCCNEFAKHWIIVKKSIYLCEAG